MQVNLFPFEKIEKNSKIIIYGFGDAGRQYLSQIKKTNWCQVLFFVDHNYSNLENLFAKVYPISKLIETEESLYDAVLISVNDRETALEIFNTLLNKGIKKEKIVYAVDRELRNADWIKKYPIEKLNIVINDKKWLETYFETLYLFVNYYADLDEIYQFYLSTLKKLDKNEKLILIENALAATANFKIPEIGLFIYKHIEIDLLFEQTKLLAEYIRLTCDERKKYCKSATEYLWELYDYVNNQEETTKKQLIIVLLEAIKSINGEWADESKIIATRLLYEMSCFNKESMDIYVDTLLSMKWKDDTPYGLVVDIAHMAFNMNLWDETDENYYIKQRKLYEKLCEYYHLSDEVHVEKEKVHKGRIAILTHEMYDSEIDICPKITAMYANELAKCGYDVRIFVVGGILEYIEGCFLHKYFSITEDVYRNLKKGRKSLSSGIEIVYSEGISPRERLKRIIKSVCDYNPTFILDMADDVSVETFTLYKKYPIIYVPFRSRGTCMVFDAYITQNKFYTLKQNKIFKSIDEKKIYEIKKSNLLPDNETVSYCRKTLGFGDDELLVVSVGHRLRYEIDKELIEKMSDLLLEFPNIRWIIVGTVPVSTNSKFNQLLQEKRVVDWGIEEHVVALYRICNVYLQPKRVGGAHGIRLAMREGLPIVMTDYPSDILNYLNKGETVCNSYEDITKCIKKLYEDKEFYDKQSNNMKEIMSELSMGKAIKKLVELCETISNSKMG